MKVLQATDTHPTADWIYDKVRKKIPNISLGTVYRNLNQLVAAGRVISFQDEKVVRYDGNTEKHDHFKCEVCGRWYDMEVLDGHFIETLNRNHEFSISDFTLELKGICGNCSLEKGN